MLSNHKRLEKMTNTPSWTGISDYYNLVFPIMGVLATYHDTLERNNQYALVRSLELGTIISSVCKREPFP